MDEPCEPLMNLKDFGKEVLVFTVQPQSVERIVRNSFS